MFELKGCGDRTWHPSLLSVFDLDSLTEGSSCCVCISSHMTKEFVLLFAPSVNIFTVPDSPRSWSFTPDMSRAQGASPTLGRGPWTRLGPVFRHPLCNVLSFSVIPQAYTLHFISSTVSSSPSTEYWAHSSHWWVISCVVYSVNPVATDTCFAEPRTNQYTVPKLKHSGQWPLLPLVSYQS